MNNFHIDESSQHVWTVRRFEGEAKVCFGDFRYRAQAEAFGRALAHRSRVELMIHPTDGTVIKVAAPNLSYPVDIA